MKSFTLKVILTTFIVAVVLLTISKIYSILSLKSALLIPILFSTNCWFALFPYYQFKKVNPFKVLVIGSLIRNLTVGFIICFYYYHYLKNGSVFLISCIFAFVIFQSVEVHQLIKDREILKR